MDWIKKWDFEIQKWDFEIQKNNMGYHIWAKDLAHGEAYEFFMSFRERKEAEDYMKLVSAAYMFDLNPNEWHLHSYDSY